MKEYTFTVVLEEDIDGNYVATCPLLPRCYSGGETIEEALAMITEVIRLQIRGILKDGESIPEEVYSAQIKIIA